MTEAGPREACVFVVDDDRGVRDSIRMLLTSAGRPVRCFENAQDFLEHIEPTQPGCLIVDIRMPGMNGLDLQDHLRRLGNLLPVIVLTAYGDVPGAVRAMKHGAVDFIQKPYDPDRLLALVEQAVCRDREARAAAARADDVHERVTSLTRREEQVMRQVLAGAASKVIAVELGISERTVELHRARMMKKMQVRSPAELVNLFRAAGV